MVISEMEKKFALHGAGDSQNGKKWQSKSGNRQYETTQYGPGPNNRRNNNRPKQWYNSKPSRNIPVLSARGGNNMGGRRNNYNGSNGGRNNKYNRDPINEKENLEKLESELFDDLEVTKGINFDLYDKIKVEVTGKDVPDPVDSFEDIENLHPQLMWNIDRSGYTKPTPVQKHAFAISVEGRDIMGVAQTGSGKTAAFLLPMIQVLLNSGGNRGVHGHGQATPIGVVLTPTRELAMQIQKEAQKFLFSTGLSSCCVYGGMPVHQQRQILRSSSVDILVATPGRLVDFLNRGNSSMRSVRFLVLDEADRMLDMGFDDQIRSILNPQFGMKPAGSRQTMMFSATFPKEIQLLAQNYMGDYVFVAIGKVGLAADSVTQQVVYADNLDKPSVLLDFFDSIEENSVLVFVQRKISASNLEYFLKSNGINAISIHGDKSQRDREFAISSFKKGVHKVLVATDVASRGLDIPNVGYVVNYDMTSSIDDYVHRIGRTGRIGNEGIALTIVSETENVKILEDLLIVLKEGKTKVPTWFENLIDQRRREKGGGRGGWQRGRGRRGSRGNHRSRGNMRMMNR